LAIDFAEACRAAKRRQPNPDSVVNLKEKSHAVLGKNPKGTLHAAGEGGLKERPSAVLEKHLEEANARAAQGLHHMMRFSWATASSCDGSLGAYPARLGISMAKLAASCQGCFC